MPIQRVKISKPKYYKMVRLAHLAWTAQIAAVHFRDELENVMKRTDSTFRHLPTITCRDYQNIIDDHFTTNN